MQNLLYAPEEFVPLKGSTFPTLDLTYRRLILTAFPAEQRTFLPATPDLQTHPQDEASDHDEKDETQHHENDWSEGGQH
jgi:hypothetical protein